MSAPKEINPWQEGFKPPAVCPNCRRVIYSLFFTGRRDQANNHVYRCSSCGSLVGAPTDYAECRLYGIELEKDVFYTPCVKCLSRKTDPTHGVCIHFSKEPLNELEAADQIEGTVKRFTKFKSLPEV